MSDGVLSGLTAGPVNTKSTLIPPPGPAPAQMIQPTTASPTPAVSLPGGVQPGGYRSFGDAMEIRKRIYQNVLDSAMKIEPLTNKLHTLHIKDVSYEGPDTFTTARQKEAVLRGDSLMRKLRGTVSLVDNATGKPVAERKMTLANVPHLTERGTLIMNGNEWTMAHQMRLRPGVYTRVKENGDIESHINVLPGKGISHHYNLDPAKGIFNIEIQQASMPLIPLLRAMGTTDKELRQTWGDEILARNQPLDSAHIINKLYDRFVNNRNDPNVSPDMKRDAVANAMSRMELDPEVTKRTLGTPFTHLTKDAILATTKKLLDVNRREAEPDDRDHLAFQRILGPEDLLAERLHKDRKALRDVFWRASGKRSLDFLQPGFMTNSLHGAIQSSGLGLQLEEINPSELFDQQTRVTRLGEGGIGDAEGIPREARSVQPSHFGFIDLIRTPECHSEDTEVLTRDGWKLWPEVTTNDYLACQVDGKLEFHKPIHLFNSEYHGPVYSVKTEFLNYKVTPNHRLWIKKAGERNTWSFETAEAAFNKSFRKFQTGGHLPCDGEDFVVPISGVSIDDWAELVAWYLSEGCHLHSACNDNYGISISQNEEANPENCLRLRELLSRLPFKWTQNGAKTDFRVYHHELAAYFKPFGFCNNKWIPEELLIAPIGVRRRLMEVLLLGDGRRNKKGILNQFCTSSKKLAEDFERLAISLGRSCRIVFEPDNRQPHYLGCYVVHIHERNERTVNRFSRWTGKPYHLREYYSGKVYCAEVPGHLLFVRRDGAVGHWSGNSFKVGVDSRFANAARKGHDGRLYSPFVDAKTGKTLYKTPQDVADLTIAFPGEMRKAKRAGRDMVAALVKGKSKFVPLSQVNLEIPDMEPTFSPLSNMVPLKSATKGQRVAMGSRMLTQALPIHTPEAPLVQSAKHDDPNTSYEEHYGTQMGAVRSRGQGRVMSVTPDFIKVRYADGKVETHEIYNHFPYSRKSVTGDTEIYILRGNSINVYRIAEYFWQEGDKTLSVDSHKRCSVWALVTGYIKHKNDKQLYRVSTKSGRQVVVTEDHSLMTMGSDGQLEPIYPEDCVINKTKLPLAFMPTVDSDIEDRGYEFGVLDGLYVSEGHCPPSQPGLVTISVQPDDRAAEVLSLLRRLGFSPFRNGGTVAFTDHKYANFLVTTYGHLSHNKRLPDDILNKSESFRKGLIVGYFGGDGCLWKGKISINLAAVTVSKRLRDGFIDLLNSFGIFCTIWNAPRTRLNKNWRDGFGLRVIAKHINKLERWFFYSDRQQKLQELLARQSGVRRSRSSTFELIPVLVSARRQLYEELAVVPHYVYKTVHLGVAAKVDLEQATGSYGEWARSDVLWDTVTKIEPVDHEEYVYDLSVEGCEAFTVCHGLLVHNTFIHNTPAVQAGDMVKPGQLLAKSNYTDDNGATALGLNPRVAFLPYKGMNYEDAVVISNSFAKRQASEHMYQHGLDFEDGVHRGKTIFMGVFPGKYDKKTLDTMDEHGVVRPGTLVKYGDPLIAAVREREHSHSQVHRKRGPTFTDASVTWDHHSDGMVTDVAHTKNGVAVTVKSYNPTQVGDKMANRFGGKGVVAHIVPDDEMPHDSEGKPYELLLNPLGVISRTNPSQVMETVLGKIAAKTGKPYKIQDFKDIDDLTDFVQQEMQKHGIKDTEDVIDPKTGRRIPNVLTGHQFFMKLHHTSESKDQGRGLGQYTAEEVPAKGGVEGSKRMAMMDTYAILSHGATEILRDAHAIRGQKNPDYWSAYQAGLRPPEPKVPLVYRKFVDHLRGAGINIVRNGPQLHLMAMTNKDVKTLVGDRFLRNPETVSWKEGDKPLPGGLFDPKLTGGHGGNQWAGIKLHEPMPSPVMEEPIRRLLGLTKNKFEDVLAGKEKINGASGPKAIYNALNDINLDKAIAQAQAEIKGSKKTARDEAIRKIGYLHGAKKYGIHPRDWFMDAVPVLPPSFRPVSTMSYSGNLEVSDANYLYKEVWDANEGYKWAKDNKADPGREALTLYNAFKGVTGLGDPVQPKHVEKDIKGLLKQVFGSNPKFGSVQRKLLGSNTDLVGRATITPNPDLDMDHVGLPEERAWTIYKPFVVRRLVKGGMGRLDAAQAVKDRKGVARNALLNEMQDRPVILDRAPVLHRYGVMAFWPQITKGHTLQVSPIVTKGFGADFDGDAMQYHVPASDEAKEEAVIKMLPSRNLFSASTFKAHYTPQQEYTGGLYAATTAKENRRPRVFRSKQDAITAYRRGEIGVGHPIEIIEDK